MSNKQHNNNKKPRKNKKDSFQLTIKTTQTVNDNHKDILYESILLFNLHKRYYLNFNQGTFTNEKQKRTQFMHYQKRAFGYLPYQYRFLQGMKQEIGGMKKSIESNNKNYILDKETKLKQVNTTITSVSKSYKKEKNRKKDFDSDKVAELKEILKNLYTKKQNIENDINELKKKKISICFGGKKLAKKRHRVKETELKAYREAWFHKRHNQMLLVGDHKEAKGNSLCQLSYNEETDTFSLNYKIPYCLQTKFNQESITIENVNIPAYQREEVKQQVLAHKYKDKKREALSFRFIYDKTNTFRLNISVNIKKPKIITSHYNGLIGIDINNDHLAVVEIDRHGNFLECMKLPLDLENKTTGQRNDIIGKTLIKLKDYALLKNKDIVVEKLDFKNKKRELKDRNQDRKYNKMLSQFSYQKILNGIDMIGNKYGIRIRKVNPAYTSLIGEVKYSNELGLSIHMAAAYVIARRGYEYKEKIRKIIHIKRQKAVLALPVPEEIRKDVGWYKVKNLKKKVDQINVGKYVPHNKRFEEIRIFC